MGETGFENVPTRKIPLSYQSAGAKALSFFRLYSARLKPCPVTKLRKSRFSAIAEVVRFHRAF